MSKIQKALIALDNASVTKAELTSKVFGETTEKAVLAYKQKRQIVNRSYQKEADQIVGVMTMASLDREMLQFESSLDETTVLSALASVLEYTPDEPNFIVRDKYLRDTVRVLQNNIRK